MTFLCSDRRPGQAFARTISLGLLFLWLAAHARPACSQEKKPHLEPVTAWSIVFGGSEATYQFAVKGFDELPKTASWSLRVDRRTISQGQVPLKAMRDAVATLSISLRFPETKPGIRFAIELQIEISNAGKSFTYSQPITLFPADPFHDRTKWLEALNIGLYDPVGKTAEVFDAAKIPYLFARIAAALKGHAGLIVIGEGVSLETERGLVEQLLAQTATGSKVLLMAPEDGALPIPGTAESDLPRPEWLDLRGAEVITALDKQLAGAWAPGGGAALSTFQIQASGDRTVWQVLDDATGWSWIELQYAPSKGRFVICGLGLIDRWEQGPDPRYLVAILLERLASEEKMSADK